MDSVMPALDLDSNYDQITFFLKKNYLPRTKYILLLAIVFLPFSFSLP